MRCKIAWTVPNQILYVRKVPSPCCDGEDGELLQCSPFGTSAQQKKKQTFLWWLTTWRVHCLCLGVMHASVCVCVCARVLYMTDWTVRRTAAKKEAPQCCFLVSSAFVRLRESVPGLGEGYSCCVIDLFDWKSKAGSAKKKKKKKKKVREELSSAFSDRKQKSHHQNVRNV